MPVRLIDWDRIERNLPHRSCKHCDYDFKGLAVEGECPECGAEYGFYCGRCDYPLVGRPLAGDCPECGCHFDKSNERKIQWQSGMRNGREIKRSNLVSLGITAVLIPAFVVIFGPDIADWIRGLNLGQRPRLSFCTTVGATGLALAVMAYSACIIGIAVGLYATRK